MKTWRELKGQVDKALKEAGKNDDTPIDYLDVFQPKKQIIIEVDDYDGLSVYQEE